MRIDLQSRNLLSIAQAEMSPCYARVRGLVDPIAERQVLSVQPFTAGHVNSIWIRGCDGDSADRLRGLIIEDRTPGSPVVVGFPHSAVDLADIEHIRLTRYAGGCAGPAATERTNHPPAKVLVSRLGNLLSLNRYHAKQTHDNPHRETMQSNQTSLRFHSRIARP